mgnify:CR=1 FL=1
MKHFFALGNESKHYLYLLLYYSLNHTSKFQKVQQDKANK